MKVYYDISDTNNVRPVAAKNKKEAAAYFHVPESNLQVAGIDLHDFQPLGRGDNAEKLVLQGGDVVRVPDPDHVPYEPPLKAVTRLEQRIDALEAEIETLKSQP